MSIYLPFGIALSQANMVQFLSVKTRQLRLLQGHKEVQVSENEPWNLKGLRNRWRCMSSLKRTYTLVGAGMVVQLVVTTIIYATNRKLQGYWGNIAETVGQVKCRKGPEW